MNLPHNLSQLERAQLVRALDDKMMAYLFKHVLVQETTYSSLLKHDRQRLHLAVARTLEAVEPERLSENAARLTQHFAEAGDDSKTLEYALRAADYAAGMFAHAEAIAQYDHALAILARRDGSPDDSLNVYLRRGRALELLGDFNGALKNYCDLEEQGMQRGEPSLELAGLVARATLYATPTSIHDVKQGAALNAQALELARQLRDRRTECKTLWNLLLVSYFESEPAQAVAYGEQALRIARDFGFREQEAYILNDISRPLISVGPLARSLESLEQARALFQEQHNVPMLADNLAATGETLVLAGEYARGLEFTERAIALSRDINSAWNLAYSGFGLMILNTEQGNLDRVFRWTEELNALPPEQHSIIFIFGAHAWHSEVYRILGDYPRALAASRQMEEWAQGSYPLALAWLKANHVRDLVASGSLDEAQAKLAEAYRENLKDYSGFGPILVRAADIELALARANPEHAIVVANSLLADLERLKIKFYRANVYCLRGKARMAQNAWDAAADDFSLADAFGKLLPARRILWETYALWSQVEQRRGKFALAAELAAQAREYALFIADHAGSAQGRALFLSHPSVQALLDPAGTQTL